jgi:ABC-type dipeptide/oligopeptide/nickel transport system permease component
MQLNETIIFPAAVIATSNNIEEAKKYLEYLVRSRSGHGFRKIRIYFYRQLMRCCVQGQNTIFTCSPKGGFAVLETFISPLYISLKTVLVSTIITFFLGIAAARWMAHSKNRYKSLIDSSAAAAPGAAAHGGRVWTAPVLSEKTVPWENCSTFLAQRLFFPGRLML